MDNLARKQSRSGEVLGIRGTVVSAADGLVHLDTPRGRLVARRAAGCLLDPAPSDEVLVATEGEEAWVLVVLERDPKKSTEIAVEGDLRLRSSRGKVALVGQDGVDVISAGAARVIANGVEVRTVKASVVLEGLELVGGWVRAELDEARLVAKNLEHVLDRYTQRARRVYRRVEDIDQLQAKAVHHRVETTMRIHAGDAAITADKVVKVDGKQVHVG